MKKKSHVPSNLNTPSDAVIIVVSFDLMSLDTEPSKTSNESHDHESRRQFGYGDYGNNPYREVHTHNGEYGYN